MLVRKPLRRRKGVSRLTPQHAVDSGLERDGHVGKPCDTVEVSGERGLWTKRGRIALDRLGDRCLVLVAAAEARGRHPRIFIGGRRLVERLRG
jgi:hypothetical protein